MKISLLLLAILCTIVSKAQITSGSLFLGGDLQISGSSTVTVDQSQAPSKYGSYTFSPVVGWAVKDNLIVGGKLIVSFSNNTAETTESEGYNYGGGFFARKYLPLGKSFYLFGEGNLLGRYNHNEQQSVQQPGNYLEQKGFGISATLYPGIAYQVKKSFFLEASLNSLISFNYYHLKQENHAGSTTYKATQNSYELSSSIGNGNPLQVGARWIIPKK